MIFVSSYILSVESSNSSNLDTSRVAARLELVRMMAPAARVLILLSLALCVFASRDLESYTLQNNTLRVPEAVEVPADYKLRILLSASGDQYYRYNGTSWVNYNAKARLYNQESKKLIGRHFYLSHRDSLGGQPSWGTLASEGVPESLVTGVAINKTTVDTSDIPWVLLKATNNQGDKNYFGHVEYVQRINTYKGLQPSATSGAHEGDVRLSSYTADYAFYVRS